MQLADHPIPLLLVAALCCYLAGAASLGAYVTHAMAGEYRPKRVLAIAVAFLASAGICFWLAWGAPLE